jgi:protein TilB
MSPKSKESGSVRASCKSLSLNKSNDYRKIDLTLNFIDIEDLEESVDNLEEVPDI